MILNIRGTGGSGKSTIVRDVMSRYARRTPCHETGRKRPAGYYCERAHEEDGPTLYVPGHYETPCGGCDTIVSPTRAFEWIEAAAKSGADVVYEGIIVQDSFERTVELSRRFRLVVLGLRVPIEVCLDGIRERRQARRDARDLDPTNTVNRQKSVERSMQRLAEAGVDARWATRDEALATCVQLLGLGDPVAQDERPFQLT